MATTKRRCYVILEGQRDPQGYIPSLVVEGESGHAPLAGRGPLAAPWYWGVTYEEAKRVCADMNLSDFGLSPDECAEIVASSMAVRRGGRA